MLGNLVYLFFIALNIIYFTKKIISRQAIEAFWVDLFLTRLFRSSKVLSPCQQCGAKFFLEFLLVLKLQNKLP